MNRSIPQKESERQKRRFIPVEMTDRVYMFTVFEGDHARADSLR